MPLWLTYMFYGGTSVVVVAVVGLVVNGGTSALFDFFFLHKIRIKESVSYIKHTNLLIHNFYLTYALSIRITHTDWLIRMSYTNF